MQIDTRNPECGRTYKDVKNCTQMTPWIEPRSARYGRDWQGPDKPALPSNYSGILECPCNGRYGGDPVFYPESGTKQITHDYAALPAGQCAENQGIATAEECFDVAHQVGVYGKTFVNKSVSDAATPHGCSVVTTKDGTTTVTFNTAGAMACANSTSHVGQATTAVSTTINVALQASGDHSTVMDREAKGKWCANNRVHVLSSFKAKSASEADMTAALQQCEAFCLGNEQCTVCSVDNLSGGSSLNVQFSALPSCGKVNTWGGAITGDISSKEVNSDGNATITLTGPADAWFGFGLDAQNMADSPYSLIVNSSGVFEQKIGTCGSEAEHCPGDALASSITLVSNTVESNVRTAVVTRSFKGLTDKHYSFRPQTEVTVNFIAAVGTSQVFAYHKAHDTGMITFTAPDQPTCLCDKGAEGKLCDSGLKNCAPFTKDCATTTQGGDLFAQHNPTCNSLQYAGGLRCCSHKRILLDEDQEVNPNLLQYHMKFRFWFQEYVPEGSTTTPQGTTKNTTASHYDLPRIYFQTEANAGEYDIPPAFPTKENPLIPGYHGYPVGKLTPGTSCTGNCPDGEDCECVHTITYNHTVSNMRLIYAGGHCHAPSCLGIWLYRNDPGHEMELLCHQQPMYGKGNVEADKWDEAGYITLPPCLWGDDEGLEPSVLLPANTPLVSIKKNKNTDMGHYGEMASWQMRGVSF